MEMGYDAVLVNSVVALARDPVTMARAFARAVEAGRDGYEAGLMSPREFASPSTPTLGTPFWQQREKGEDIECGASTPHANSDVNAKHADARIPRP